MVSPYGITEKEIVSMVGVTRQAVNKKLCKNEHFCVGTRANPAGGRPLKVYRRDVLSLWDISSDVIREKSKRRKHYGTVQEGRGRKAEVAEYVAAIAFKLYLANALADVRESCRLAISRAYENVENGVCPFTADDISKIKENEYLYKQYVMRKDKHNVGVYYTEGWQQQWFAHNKKWTAALTKGTLRWDIWRVLENDFGACEGNGGGRFVGLDDRKSDVWMKDKLGNPFMAWGVYAWDLLTGELLHVEYDRTISSETYIRCILQVIFRHGCDCPIFSMENAKAAVAYRVKNVIQSLYTEEDKKLLQQKEYRLLLKDDVVSRNVPHIPKGLFKGTTERNFQEIKAGEALLFPRNFQGGNKREQIELSRNNMPTFGAYTPDFKTYAAAIREYANTDLLDKERDSLKKWAEYHGCKPTRRAMIEYYRPAVKKQPSAKQIAYLLYFTTREKARRKMKNIGTLEIKYLGLQYSLSAPELFSYSPDQEFACVPIPDTKRESGRYEQWLVFIENGAHEFPDFIGLAKSYNAESIEQGHRLGLELRAQREAYDKRKQEIKPDYSYSENRIQNIQLNAANTKHLEDIIEVDGTVEIKEEIKQGVSNADELIAKSKQRLKRNF